MSDRYEDDRGVIQDCFNGEPVHVTHILTLEGAVRGNHVHEKTWQWTLVVRGLLEMAAPGGRTTMMGPGQLMAHPPGDPHAWRALEDTECYVFTRGPRGEDYESDTIRLKEPLLS